MQSHKERYETMLTKLDSIRENMHLIESDKLDEAVLEMEKIEIILKQLEDFYGHEL